jgi:GAF domain-containing protein
MDNKFKEVGTEPGSEQSADRDHLGRSLHRLGGELSHLVKRLASELSADVVTLFLYDVATGEFHLPIGYGLYDPATFIDPRMRPRPDRIAGKIAKEGKAFIVYRVSGKPNVEGAFTHREKIISTGGFPLIYNDKSVGVLFISYRSAHLFSGYDKQTIMLFAHRAASVIGQAEILPALGKHHSLPRTDKEKAISLSQAITNLACNVLHTPMAIWVPKPDSQELHILAMSGLTYEYAEASAAIGDNTLISHVFQTGEEEIIHNILTDHRYHYPGYAQRAGWISILGLPIKLRGQIHGVIELFGYKPHVFGTVKLNIARQIAELVSITLESTFRSGESQRLGQIANQLSTTPGFDRAMHIIVEGARELTGANSSIIFVFQKRTASFIIGAHAPAEIVPPSGLPRLQEGLTVQIIESAETIRIDDITRDARVREDLIHAGICSLVGTRVQIEEENIGVLYVYGQRPGQFTENDQNLMQALAAQASVALGWTRMLLKPSEDIEQATSNLFRTEDILENICSEIQSSLDFEFVAVQLLRPEENIIETIYSIGPVEQWSGRSRHFLEEDPELRDIQADIVKTTQTEIISGWDTRFDDWIYRVYRHDKLSRVITPIILVRDITGQVIRNWFEYCYWEVVQEEENADKRHITIKMHLEDLEDAIIEVIGTIEAGYCDAESRIEIDQAIDLAKLVSREAFDIYSTLLPYVLEATVRSAARIVQADSATLHFLYDHNQHRYIYQIGAGHMVQRMLKNIPSFIIEFGQQAIKDKETKVISYLTQNDSPLSFDKSSIDTSVNIIQSVAVFPLVIDEGEGFLCVYFGQEHQLGEDEMKWVELFVKRAAIAIRHVTVYTQMRDRERQMQNLHSLARYLVNSPDELDLLQYIAGSTLNILAADIVIIYEYTELERRLGPIIGCAGRIRSDNNLIVNIDQLSTPALLIRHNHNIYAESLEEVISNPILNNPERVFIDQGQTFVIREKIASSAGILLKVGVEILGVMFINYRRPHKFSAEDRKSIETLTSSAAIAIKNQRLLSINTFDREIMTTLKIDELLRKILIQSIDIAGADIGEVWLLDVISDELVIQDAYPPALSVTQPLSRIKIGDGIIGMVSLRGKSILVNELPDDSYYMPYYSKLRSVLYVPLLDKDGHTIGVLMVGSHQTNAFSRKYQLMLERIANLAVIAIQNAENQKHLVAAELMATLGDLAGPLVHWINNEVGAIRVWSGDIQNDDWVGEVSKYRASEIQLLAEQVLQKVQNLKRWVLERPQPINIHKLIIDVLEHTKVPSNIVQNVNISSEISIVLGGEQQLIDVFDILIQNAFDAMTNGGTLSIESKEVQLSERSWSIISVCDTGNGIADEDLERIFQRNYSTKEGESRLGFGLWWARTYIQRLHGNLTVEGRLGEGAKFTMLLPAYELEV